MNKSILVVVIMLVFVTGNAHVTLTDGLVAYYPFNGNAQNQGGLAPDGQVYSAVLTHDRFGNPDSAYLFDGIDDYIEVPNTNGVFDLTASWSISAWIKPLTGAIL